ncbi:EF-P beta-lysylation protein EpmB [Buchnera aphidicola (Brachycaudus cardui)]|uniref:L-lysine 2,3-aminomutase n=1 Tax=Buchnera aphidicola (Brachycaudus cardui) TaxID=557993 RepID=A0A4D6Y2B7_9GAMM|nr:EF-P beta-lysylation protein EpmB [Buchnera aphidicola]QCI20724.1 EF-P beta-lysylation protein EpmB [Buchnera aphidicola (Brachycaudus cardui)]
MKLITVKNVILKDQWLYELSNSITEPKKLLQILNLKKHPEYHHYKSNTLFPFRVPYSFVSRMQKNNPKDPLLLQVIINNQEFLHSSEYIHDPIKEKKNIVLPGLLHKYNDRILLLVKTNCAIHCRYCFRKYFPYEKNQGSKINWIKSLEYIKNNKNLNEVILSGGDPLIAKDHELSWLITSISDINHIKRLRIHTRLPIVIPNRITSNLCKIFLQSRLKIIIVTHINHPQEINNHLSKSLLKLKQSGVILLNQSVLLKNINDDPTILAELSNLLCENNILPYYLHLLDQVTGTMHFAVSLTKAKSIMKHLMKMISGYLVPKLVCDTGSKDNKLIII